MLLQRSPPDSVDHSCRAPPGGSEPCFSHSSPETNSYILCLISPKNINALLTGQVIRSIKIITELEIVALRHQQILIKTNMKRYARYAVDEENNLTVYLSFECNTGKIQFSP